jgi:hypothetical protein
VNGKDIPTAPISSYARAREIATILKDWIASGRFLLTQPVEPLPGLDSGIKMNTLDDRTLEELGKEKQLDGRAG